MIYRAKHEKDKKAKRLVKVGKYLLRNEKRGKKIA